MGVDAPALTELCCRWADKLANLEIQFCHTWLQSISLPDALRQQTENQSEDDADYDRRRDGEVEPEPTARTLILDVARQQG